MEINLVANRRAMCQRSPAIRRPALSRLRARIDCKLQVTAINIFSRFFFCFF